MLLKHYNILQNIHLKFAAIKTFLMGYYGNKYSIPIYIYIYIL